MRTSFYNNYLTEETLVKTIDCGGYLEQPICLYDFTVKGLSHDCLNFSTRHISEEGRSSYINYNYITQIDAKPSLINRRSTVQIERK